MGALGLPAAALPSLLLLLLLAAAPPRTRSTKAQLRGDAAAAVAAAATDIDVDVEACAGAAGGESGTCAWVDGEEGDLADGEFGEMMDAAEVAAMRGAVKDAMAHAWDGYVRYAWGADELMPHAAAARNWTSTRSLGLTIVDSLDTLHLMGMHAEFAAGLAWVRKNLGFKTNVFVNVFEISIRCLGGLLSAYYLSGDPTLVEKARDLGTRLLPAFEESRTGVPYSDVNLRTGSAEAGSSDSSLSEATSVQLEFKYLANATGDARFAVEAERAMDAVWRAAGKLPGSVKHVLPLFLSPTTGTFKNGVVSLGARGDSYYEYLLKQYLLTGKTEQRYRDAYLKAVDAIAEHLVSKTKHELLSFVGELPATNLPSGVTAKMDHLVCFLPGTLALGYMHGVGHDDEHLERQLALARELAETCYLLYSSTPTGLAPEIAHFETAERGKPKKGIATAHPDIYIKSSDAHYILRPEVVESLYLLHAATGDGRYRRYGWRIFQAIEEHCRVPSGGYAGVANVLSANRPGRRDSMETFFTGETLKYLYLLFSDGAVDLTQTVFTTEAHLLPVIPPAS